MTSCTTGIIVRPRLSPKVRLRFDRRTGRWLLLYPEAGLELNGTASVIARLCTGNWTVDDMALSLGRIYPDISPSALQRDIRDFIEALAGRGLLVSQHE